MGCKTCKKESKMNCRRGLWSPYEDQKLFDYILKHGHECWSAVPTNAGLQRNGKSCRLRWVNYLRPGLKRGSFSADEKEIILNLQAALGNKWSQIAMHLPGRTDNEIKNFWNTHLKKKVLQDYNKESETNASANTSQPSTNMEEYLDPLGQLSANQTMPRVLFADWLNGDLLSNNYINDIAGGGSSSSGSADDHQDVHRPNSADVGATSTKDDNIGISEEYGMQICPISEALESWVDLQSMDELWDSLDVI